LLWQADGMRRLWGLSQRTKLWPALRWWHTVRYRCQNWIQKSASKSVPTSVLSVMQIRIRNRHKTQRRKLAPIRTYSKPIISVKLDAWLVDGHCWHFHLLSGLLVSWKVVTQKQLLAFISICLSLSHFYSLYCNIVYLSVLSTVKANKRVHYCRKIKYSKVCILTLHFKPKNIANLKYCKQLWILQLLTKMWCYVMVYEHVAYY